MYKKTITYVDYDGNERTEDFYFNLTTAELSKMDMGTVGGMKKLLEKIVAEKDVKRISEIFEEIIQKAYGVKSPDGRRFIKSAEVLDDFIQTEAYSIFYMELATNTDEAIKFINGIIPQDLSTGSKPVIAPIA